LYTTPVVYLAFDWLSHRLGRSAAAGGMEDAPAEA